MLTRHRRVLYGIAAAAVVIGVVLIVSGALRRAEVIDLIEREHRQITRIVPGVDRTITQTVTKRVLVTTVRPYPFLTEPTSGPEPAPVPVPSPPPVPGPVPSPPPAPAPSPLPAALCALLPLPGC